MTAKDATILKAAHFKKLLRTPDQDLMGEVIRLNCTLYNNALDVVKVCVMVRENRQNLAAV
jgi:hypothetical protein